MWYFWIVQIHNISELHSCRSQLCVCPPWCVPSVWFILLREILSSNNILLRSSVKHSSFSLLLPPPQFHLLSHLQMSLLQLIAYLLLNKKNGNLNGRFAWERLQVLKHNRCTQRPYWMSDAQFHQLVFTAEILSVYVNHNKLSIPYVNKILYNRNQGLFIFMSIVEDFFQLAI